MNGTLRLGKIAGIRLQVHWTFVLIIIWAIYIGWKQGGTTEAVLWTIAFVLSIFVCVILHELGHSLTARRFGIPTRKITLLPIGGVASLARMPEEPKQELLVAIMGPVVNVVISIILFFFVHAQLSILSDTEAAAEFLQSINGNNFLLYLFYANITLVLFNIIPAFPMDGGRVLRALLSFKLDRVRATQIAANLGQFIAVLFFFIGILYNPILIFIGLFVFFGASGEYMMIRQTSMLSGHRVRDSMMTNFTIFHPEDTLEKVGQTLLAGTERQFLVLDHDGKIVGALYKENITEAFRSHKQNLTVADIMDRNLKIAAPDAELNEIYRAAQSRQSHFFPVVENGQLIGVIDMENINEFMMIQAKLDY